jgi:hypothetical protein
MENDLAVKISEVLRVVSDVLVTVLVLLGIILVALLVLRLFVTLAGM